jgi:hypothetical protein
LATGGVVSRAPKLPASSVPDLASGTVPVPKAVKAVRRGPVTETFTRPVPGTVNGAVGETLAGTTTSLRTSLQASRETATRLATAASSGLAATRGRGR